MNYSVEAEQELHKIRVQIRTIAADVSHWAANLDSDEDAINEIYSIVNDLKIAAKELEQEVGAG